MAAMWKGVNNRVQAKTTNCDVVRCGAADVGHVVSLRSVSVRSVHTFRRERPAMRRSCS